VREPILRGLLGADLIGFQTASFARHFRQTVSRILSVEALPRGIQLPPDIDFDEHGNPKKFYLAGESKSYPRLAPQISQSNVNVSALGAGSAPNSPIVGGGGASVPVKKGKGRFVDTGVFPMGIDVRNLKEKQ
jgi:trehalose 6-phosphate synthase complex regulatory subunit